LNAGIRGTNLSTNNVKTLMAMQDRGYTPTGTTSAEDSPYKSGSSGTGSLSYSAVRDLNVNIYFSHSFVNGDSEDIAIMLRDEIARAERKGY
jgi:hypothetical protein